MSQKLAVPTPQTNGTTAVPAKEGAGVFDPNLLNNPWRNLLKQEPISYLPKPGINPGTYRSSTVQSYAITDGLRPLASNTQTESHASTTAPNPNS